MVDQNLISRGYTIRIARPLRAADGYHVVYTPRGLHRAGDPGLLHAIENGGVPLAGWRTFRGGRSDAGRRRGGPLVDPASGPRGGAGAVRAGCEGPSASSEWWLDRLSALVNEVESWAKGLGWSTRRIEKPMEDAQIGKYKAPSLLMQEGTDRILLEPIARSAPGTEGVVDLYLMPAYEDIASLYFEDGRWNLHYLFAGTVAANTRDAPAKPLSRETLQEVLAEMRQHAA